MAELNFGYGGIEPAGTQDKPQGEPTTELDDNGNPINPPKDNPDNSQDKPQDNPQDNPQDKPQDKPADENKLVEGTILEVEDKKYTVDKDGNLIDETGAIFKEAKDVQDWLKEFETTEEEEENQLSVENISKALDIQIVDENGEPIQYENTPEGVKAFVKDAIDTEREEIAEATINSLYSKFYFIKPMIDYYIANGNSLEGYNEIPDRSKIEINDEDTAQQEAIVRMAWKENNRRGNVDAYIDYLKSSNTLAVVAKEELAGLQESDKDKREKLEADAKAAHQKALEESNAYWGKVKSVIESKKLAGYQLPENIIVERNGKKVSATLSDFYNYIARNDKDGLTDYAKDLLQQSAESKLEDDILRAYLTFTGGNYSNLIDMAINEEKVKNLKLRAIQNRKNTIRVTPPKQDTSGNNNDYGY